RTAFDLAVYASQGWSPTHHARLASGCWSGSTGRDWLPAGFHLKGFKLPTILLSRASWRDVSSSFRVVRSRFVFTGRNDDLTPYSLFDQFDELGSCWRLYRHRVRNQIRLGMRV